MTHYARIELQKEAMKFSSGHFTIFSATQREPVHGHNFLVGAELVAPVSAEGLTFDYRIYRRKLVALCQELNCRFLVPMQSPHLAVSGRAGNVELVFNGDVISLPKADVLELPLTNTTSEELSRWFVTRLTAERDEIDRFRILELSVRVATTPGQWAVTRWSGSDE
ncbi:MAG: 6-carboxytetrahydropterin synthase [Actinobacteria bacterium]|nr:6-carboxytetrahydropterin synthase [Actinomycetota bacterium]